MAERPILFSAPMVRALLAGTKTQTRRLVKGAPDNWAPIGPDVYSPTVVDRNGEEQPGPDAYGAGNDDGSDWIRCPYGKPGDRLWVRETWAVKRHEPCLDHERDYQEQCGTTIRYLADGAERRIDGNRSTGAGIYRGPVERTRVSIHMPRWASRLTLEITGVRAERLQDISDEDALAEGVSDWIFGPSSPRSDYRALWESINGAGSWDANPWVWAIEFKRVTP